jgi:hypothetical protein
MAVGCAGVVDECCCRPHTQVTTTGGTTQQHERLVLKLLPCRARDKHHTGKGGQQGGLQGDVLPLQRLFNSAAAAARSTRLASHQQDVQQVLWRKLCRRRTVHLARVTANN